jgi:hypothetical protein
MKAFLPEVGYGLVLSAAYFGWLIIEYAAGLHTTRIAQHGLVTNLYAIIPLLLLWRAIKQRRDVIEGGQILWWQGIASGMIISVVSAALRAPTLWFYWKFIHPGYTSAMIEFSVLSGQKRELAEVAYNPTILMMEGTLAPVLLGFVLSVALTWLAKAQVEKPEAPVEAS